MKAALVLAFTGVLGVAPARGAPAQAATTFRARNPQAWTTVTVGPQGFVDHVVTRDPALQIRTLDTGGHYQWDDAALGRVRAVLRANADLFGIDAADADHVVVANGNVAYYDNDTGFLLVAIKVDPEPGLDIAIVQPRIHLTLKLTADAVAARVIGHTYLARSTQLQPAQLDCKMGGTRTRCAAKTTVETRRITITADDVTVTQGMITFAGARRLVHCLDLGQTPRSQRVEPEQPTLQLRPSDGGPAMPLLIDAVTGKRLAVSDSTCDEIWRRFVN